MLRGVLLLLSTSHQAGKTHGASAAPFFTPQFHRHCLEVLTQHGMFSPEAWRCSQLS